MRKTKQNITVPLIVDAVRNFDGLEMVRCMYFSIETDLPFPDWHLSLGKFQIPVILVGLSAIYFFEKVFRPDCGKNIR